MSWSMVAGAAISVVGGAINNRAAGKGADAQVQAQMAGIDEQRRQFDTTRQDMMPWLDAGRTALGQQQAVLRGDYSGFENSPDYLYARQQGLQSLDYGASARGGFMGGGADADRMSFASGLATQNLGNYWNKLSSVSGTGHQTATNLGQFGANMAGQIGNAYGNIGAARASSYAAQANTWNNVLNQGANLFGQWAGSRG